MADPLLSSLCRICNIQVPKYTCPRCSLKTCSMKCSRRHKLWSSCNGIRDPTVFKPRSQLATPSGIDHDYNFLHSIEYGIERSEKEIVEERRLVSRQELAAARKGENVNDRQEGKRKRNHKQNPGEACIERELINLGTRVDRAPKGMRRYMENGTSWSKNQKCIHWQVEWIREGSAGRFLSKAMSKSPIGEVYAVVFQEERRRNMTDMEKRMDKKRKADEVKQMQAKRMKTDGVGFGLTTLSTMQDSQTGAWNLTPTWPSDTDTKPIREESPMPDSQRQNKNYHFYLHRPYTPSSFPKVLVPLNSTQSLSTLLRRRVVLEFPTIYVLDCGPTDLPQQFMLEEDFLVATGQPPLPDTDHDMRTTEEGEGPKQVDDEEEKDEEEEQDDDETSSSGSSAGDSNIEDGEII